MKFKEDIKQATELLKLALPELSKHKLPATPYHYGVWYAYMTGLLPGLSKELNQIIKTYGTCTTDQSIELYKKYVINDFIAVDNKLEDNFQKIMTDVGESAEQTGKNADDLEKQLTYSLKSLNDSGASTDIQLVIQTIASKTKQVSDSTRQFKKVLDNAQSEISRLKEELQQAQEEARKDVLTKLYNRRSFDHHMLRNLETKADNEILALVMMDIDHFKRFNDTYGHLMGDTVLKAMGKVLNEACEDKGYLPCRLGGEEFAILMPRTNMREALMFAENARKKIASLVLKDKKNGKKISNITASFGLTFAEPEDSPESFLDRADAALYKAKKSGRDRVESST
jgi:diguanylate cyclase